MVDYQTKLYQLESELDSFNFSVRGFVLFKQDLVLNMMKKDAEAYYSSKPFATYKPINIDDAKTPSEILERIDSALSEAMMYMSQIDPRYMDVTYQERVKWSFIKDLVLAIVNKLGGEYQKRIIDLIDKLEKEEVP